MMVICIIDDRHTPLCAQCFGNRSCVLWRAELRAYRLYQRAIAWENNPFFSFPYSMNWTLPADVGQLTIIFDGSSIMFIITDERRCSIVNHRFSSQLWSIRIEDYRQIDRKGTKSMIHNINICSRGQASCSPQTPQPVSHKQNPMVFRFPKGSCFPASERRCNDLPTLYLLACSFDVQISWKGVEKIRTKNSAVIQIDKSIRNQTDVFKTT